MISYGQISKQELHAMIPSSSLYHRWRQPEVSLMLSDMIPLRILISMLTVVSRALVVVGVSVMIGQHWMGGEKTSQKIVSLIWQTRLVQISLLNQSTERSSHSVNSISRLRAGYSLLTLSEPLVVHSSVIEDMIQYLPTTMVLTHTMQQEVGGVS